MNHLYPPFNDVRARRAVLMAMSQEDYMRALVGDDTSLWKPLPGFFTPGTPLYTEEGGDILKGPRDLDAAKKLLAESGYSGEPVTCLVAQDQPITKAQGDVTADLSEAHGHECRFRRDRLGHGRRAPRAENAARPGRLADVPHLARRRRLHQSRAPISRIRANGDKAWFGWPNSHAVETEVAAWFDAKSLDEEKAAIDRLNKAALDDVVYAPTGFFLSYRPGARTSAASSKGPLPFFWGVSRPRDRAVSHDDARLHPSAHSRDHPRDGDRRAVRVQPALHRARRSGRGHRRRTGDARPTSSASGKASVSTGRSWCASANWVWQILHGDLGTSIFTNLPVTTMIAQRIEPTLSLMAITLVLTIVVAMPLGVARGLEGRHLDRPRSSWHSPCSASRCRSS